ncbi:PAAR domain-containing protein [Paraburkholderia sacchari]|uniref:PAAR domain-containing protein n=1 Tax=Paraburkholderia sacchari TaxID=159450 RepID=UPI0039A657DB
MAHRSVILVGDVTDHGGVVLTGSTAHYYGGKPVARVGDIVSCPTHGDNAIKGAKGAILVDGRIIAVEGMSTQCGSHLIASQTMFNTLDSKQDSDGTYHPLWDLVSPGQPQYSPHGASPFPGEVPLSPVPPDNVPVPVPPSD